METYLDRIKLLKNNKKMTNEQLSERSGIPLGTLSKVLAGMSDSPKLSTMVALCNALDCSIEYVVSGTPENHNNYLLSEREMKIIEQYRTLDVFGQDLAELVIAKEAERATAHATDTGTVLSDKPSLSRLAPDSAKVLQPIVQKSRYAGRQARTGRRSVLLYELPVSAGVGVYLDEDKAEVITIPNNEKTAEADYALRISGNSMEPKYHDGDILLVQNSDSVDAGEAGIFLLDGSGFFKIFGGDRLYSLNPEYAPILLQNFEDVQCRGRVVGKLKRK